MDAAHVISQRLYVLVLHSSCLAAGQPPNAMMMHLFAVCVCVAIIIGINAAYLHVTSPPSPLLSCRWRVPVSCKRLQALSSVQKQANLVHLLDAVDAISIIHRIILNKLNKRKRVKKSHKQLAIRTLVVIVVVVRTTPKQTIQLKWNNRRDVKASRVV